jgi:hypothetical protein
MVDMIKSGSSEGQGGVMNEVIAELSLAELVSDPLVGLLMKSDGVERRSIEVLFERLVKQRSPDFCRLDREGAAA